MCSDKKFMYRDNLFMYTDTFFTFNINTIKLLRQKHKIYLLF